MISYFRITKMKKYIVGMRSTHRVGISYLFYDYMYNL